MLWRCSIRWSRFISAKADLLEEPSTDQDEIEARLYLIGPAETPVDGLFSDSLAVVLEQVRPAAFLLRQRSIGEDAARDLRRIAREREVAFLIEDQADLAIAIEADGVHLNTIGQVQVTRGQLPRDHIIGADAGRSRHDAMEAGECGADYVAFGQFGDPVDDELLEMIAWWRDLFILPCLTYASNVDEAAKLADAGADFIGVSDAIWNHPEGPDTSARRIQAAIDKN